MTFRLSTCCIIATLLPALAAAQTSRTTATDPLSLDMAIRLAIENNRSLAIARHQVEEANEELLSDKTRRLPAFSTTTSLSHLLTPVNFSFPAGSFGTFPSTGPIPSTETSVSSPRKPTLFLNADVQQPLTQLIRINLGVASREVSRDIERVRLQDKEQSLVANVKKVYFAIVQGESALKASDEAISLYRELSRTLGERVAQRVALRADALDVQVRLAQEELTRMQRVNALSTRKEQLNQLLGRDIRTDFVVDDLSRLTALDIDVQAAQRRALERPDVAEARLKVKQAEIDRRAKKAERIPDIGVFAAYLSNLNMDVMPQNMASAGVQMTWEPFDWGRKSRELAAKTHVAEQARLAVRETEDRAILDVNDRFRTLQETRARLAVAAAGQDAARERLRVRANQFDAQAALVSDVLHERSNVASADDQLQQALVAFWTAKADFEHAVGEDVIR